VIITLAILRGLDNRRYVIEAENREDWMCGRLNVVWLVSYVGNAKEMYGIIVAWNMLMMSNLVHIYFLQDRVLGHLPVLVACMVLS